ARRSMRSHSAHPSRTERPAFARAKGRDPGQVADWLAALPEAESLDHQPSERGDPHQCCEEGNNQHGDAEPPGSMLGCRRAGCAHGIDDLWAIDVKGCIHDTIAGRDLSL